MIGRRHRVSVGGERDGNAAKCTVNTSWIAAMFRPTIAFRKVKVTLKRHCLDWQLCRFRDGNEEIFETSPDSRN